MRTVAKFPPELGIEEFETVMVNQYGEIIQHMKCHCKTYLEDLGGVRNDLVKNRVIMNFAQEGVSVDQILRSLRAMIVDGGFIAS